jgi:hypothetical protein
MAFDYDGFYARLALSCVKKQHYIRTMENFHPELLGWESQFQASINHHPRVAAFIDEATVIACDKNKTKNLLTHIRNYYQRERQNINHAHPDDKHTIKHKVGLAAIVFTLNNRDATTSLEKYGIPHETASQRVPDVETTSVNDQSLFSEQNQAVYQTVFYNYNMM